MVADIMPNCQFARSLCALLLMVALSSRCLPFLTAGDDVSGTDTECRRTDVRLTLERYAKAREEYLRLRRQAETPEARSELRARLLPPVPNAVKLVHWAQRNPDDALALRALRLVIEYGPFTPVAESAAAAVTKDHLSIQGEDFRQVVMAVQSTPPPVAEKCLEMYIEKSDIRRTRAMACWALGVYKAQLLSWSHMLGTDVRRAVPAKMTPYLRELDREAALAAAESLLERAMTEFGDVDIHMSPSKTIKLSELARRDHERVIREFKSLAIGEPAPDIDGESVLGERIRLSDYRGKVVVLTFWSTSCIPCMRMIPHERALVQQYQDRPFALLGVNTDRVRETAVDAVGKHKITWPSWWDGGETGGPISKRWSVTVQPTVYVLDHKGVIRHKHLRDKHLDEAIESRLREIEP